jgi:hypothetical protein
MRDFLAPSSPRTHPHAAAWLYLSSLEPSRPHAGSPDGAFCSTSIIFVMFRYTLPFTSGSNFAGIVFIFICSASI